MAKLSTYTWSYLNYIYRAPLLIACALWLYDQFRIKACF